jgi:hypothetical protein
MTVLNEGLALAGEQGLAAEERRVIAKDADEADHHIPAVGMADGARIAHSSSWHPAQL